MIDRETLPGDGNALVLRLLAALTRSTPETVDQAFDTALAELGQFAGADRCYIFERHGADAITNTYEWVADGVPAMIDQLDCLPLGLIEEWMPALQRGDALHELDIQERLDGSPLASILQGQGIHALLLVPFSDGTRFEGFIGFDNIRESAPFSPASVTLLRAAADLVWTTLNRIRTEGRLRRANARMSAVLDAMPDLVFELDAEHRYTGIAAGPPALMALHHGGTGQHISDAMPPEILQVFQAGLDALDPTGEAAGAHRYSVDGPTGTVWCEATFTPVQMADGRAGAICVVRDVTESVHRATRLERMSTAAEMMTNHVILSTRDGSVLWANRAFIERSGYPLDEMIGRPLVAFTRSPASDPDAAARIADAMARGAPFSGEIMNRTRAGEDYWVDLNISTARPSAGEDPVIVNVGTDVTPLKRAEERLANVIHGAAVGAWEWTPDPDGVALNARFASILKRDHATLDGCDGTALLALVHDEDRARAGAAMRALLLGESEIFDDEFRMIRGDGKPVWVEVRGRALARDGAGRAMRVAGVLMDITGRKESEAALRCINARLSEAMARRDAAEKRFLDIAAVSDDWFFELDSDLRHVYLSENFEKLLGRPAQSMLHQPLDALAPGATGSAEWAALIARLEAREPFADAMFEHERGTGERVWLRLSGTPFHDPEGTFLGYRGVGSDVTALYAERLRAIEGSAAKGRMLATMSHEIRTPLNGILGMAELLDPLLDHDGQREMLTTIRASGEILVGMLDNLLDMSKIEAGQLELVSAPLVPRDVVEKTMSLYRERARQKGIAFELKADPGAARPRLGDAHRLQQILQNLVSNAFKFTAQGHVTIRLSAPADHPVTIDVADSGIGMSPEQAETVFEAYRQADSRIASRYGGTGLGLSIVHELVAAMGGVISVDSTPGAGTRFRLTLPLCEVRDLSTPSVIGAQHLGGPAHEAALAGKRLLLADDSETNLAVLRGMLRHTGAHCVEARDGLEVVARWTEQARGRAGAPFDLLALDINMPGKTGREAMAELRTHEAALGFAPVPALAVTADVQPEQVVESIAAGFDAVLAKPFGRSNLVGVASRLVAERDVDREIEPSPPADPSNCRVLIADDDEIAREILTEFLRVADPAFEVQVATDGRAALMAGLTQTYGLMILDRNMPGIPGDRVIRALRGGRSANRDTPMVLASGETDRARFGRRDVGEADFYATKPLDMSSFVSAIRTLTGRSSAQQAATGT